jgi:hypothetical protein
VIKNEASSTNRTESYQSVQNMLERDQTTPIVNSPSTQQLPIADMSNYFASPALRARAVRRTGNMEAEK